MYWGGGTAWLIQVQRTTKVYMQPTQNFYVPSLLESSRTRPAKQVSVTSEMFEAHRPMA